ncbi:MAG: hypothetical protein WC661_17085 [Opitutaceae bacterium]|jgi:hypothetical protein
MNTSPAADMPPPPVPRRFFSWSNARRALLGLAGICTLIAAFFVIEGWRGRRAWAEVEALARSRGEPITLAEVVPAPVPDAENFAATPLVAALFSPDEKVVKAAIDRWRLATVDDTAKEPGFDPARLGGRSVPDAWRDYLKTNDLIAYLGRYDRDLAELAEATRRPFSRFPVRYEDGFRTTLPYLTPLHLASKLLCLRAEARLERGQTAGAAEDAVTLLRLAKALGAGATLIDQLMAKTMAERGLQVLRAGLATHAWTEMDLATFDAGLARLDLLGAVWRSWRVELALSSTLIRQAVDQPRMVSEAMSVTTNSTVAGKLCYVCPSGWFYQNAAFVGHIYLDNLFPSYDGKARRIDFVRLKKMETRVLEKRFSPYRFLAFVIIPSMERTGFVFAAGQTQVDLARTAITLDLWRRRHGAYPTSLAELPAAQGAGVLHDLATGDPFRYRRNDDGSYLLYATGVDGVDDGGKAVKKDSGRPDIEKGDWVWTDS